MGRHYKVYTRCRIHDFSKLNVYDAEIKQNDDRIVGSRNLESEQQAILLAFQYFQNRAVQDGLIQQANEFDIKRYLP